MSTGADANLASFSDISGSVSNLPQLCPLLIQLFLCKLIRSFLRRSAQRYLDDDEIMDDKFRRAIGPVEGCHSPTSRQRSTERTVMPCARRRELARR